MSKIVVDYGNSASGGLQIFPIPPTADNATIDTSSFVDIDCGFAPRYFIYSQAISNVASMHTYDAQNNKYYRAYNGTTTDESSTYLGQDKLFYVSGTHVYIKKYNASTHGGVIYYYAIA